MGVVIVKKDEAALEVNLGHPIVPMGNLWHSYVVVREPIEQLFGMVSVVGPALVY